MLEHSFSDTVAIVLLSMTFMAYLAFPGVSANLWQSIKDNRSLRKSKKLLRKKRQRADKLRKYWEINTRNFKS